MKKEFHPKQEMVAFVGELIGTTMFLFLALAGTQTAQNSETVSQQQTASVITLSNQTIMYISLSFGFSLLVNAWIFYRITGGLFNPAVTFALWAIGGLSEFRAVSLTVAQIAGGILGAGLTQLLLPYTVKITTTTLAPGMNIAMGLFLEAFLTAMLVFAVLMLAAEKHRATYLAPIGIGLVLFVCQLVGTEWTGCGMNPARSFGPSVIVHSFPGYHWIYWAGPYIGSCIAVGFYIFLKAFDYGSVVLGQDADSATPAESTNPYKRAMGHMHFTHEQRSAMVASGISHKKIDAAEKGLSSASTEKTQNGIPNGTARPAAGKRTSAAAPFAARPVGGRKPSRMRPGGSIQGADSQRNESPGGSGIGTASEAQDFGGINQPHTHTGAGLSKLTGSLA